MATSVEGEAGTTEQPQAKPVRSEQEAWKRQLRKAERSETRHVAEAEKLLADDGAATAAATHALMALYYQNRVAQLRRPAMSTSSREDPAPPGE